MVNKLNAGNLKLTTTTTTDALLSGDREGGGGGMELTLLTTGSIAAVRKSRFLRILNLAKLLNPHICTAKKLYLLGINAITDLIFELSNKIIN